MVLPIWGEKIQRITSHWKFGDSLALTSDVRTTEAVSTARIPAHGNNGETESIVSLLSGAVFFAGLGKEQLREVAAMGKVEFHGPDKLIYAEKEPPTDFYVLLEGKARVHKRNVQGSQVDLAILSKGKTFGAEALLEGVPQSASVSTVEDCRLFLLSRNDFFALLARYPILIRGQLASLAARIREFHDKLVFHAVEKNILRIESERQRFRSLIDVARAISEARTMEEALQAVLNQVCAFTGWSIGHAYLVEEAFHKNVVSTPVWHVRNPQRHQPLVDLTGLTQFAPGSELPPRVLETGRIQSIPDLSSESGTARMRLAHELGFVAAHAFPVMLGGDVVAILEFFTEKRGELEELFVQTMHSLGAQLGRAIERKHWEEQLLHNAHHDPLTSLPNRALFLDRLQMCLAHAKRNPEYLFAVLFIDLDGFKQINDCMGHPIGDKFLVEVACRLQTSVRAVDTVARLGGDEFAVLLDDLAHGAAIPRTIERIRSQLSVPFTLAGRELVASASIGITLSSTGYEQSEDVLRDADIAMYRAKHAGRGQAQMFDRSMHEEAVRTLQLETNLRRAIQEKELRLHYQPIVSLEDGKLQGFEALVRWPQPDGSMIMPDAFLPTAEQSGLMIPLSDWALREGSRQLREWGSKFGGMSKLYMSLNLTPSYLVLPDLVERVLKIIGESQLPPSQMVLEITESEVISNVEAGAKALRQLSDAGIRIYVDDFGTGYSSLNYLARLRVNALKIDRSFIARIPDDVRSEMIVRTITTLGQNLGLDVVAEGVETEEQRECLRDLKCECAQGFLFHKPMPAEQLPELFVELGVKAKTVSPARLRTFDIFSELSDLDLDEIADACEERTIPSGTVMIRQGQVGQEIFFIEEGEAGVYKTHAAPATYTAVLQPPALFGEQALMDPERIRTANVVALTDLRVIAVQITTFIGYLRRHPMLGNKIKQLIKDRSRRAPNRAT